MNNIEMDIKEVILFMHIEFVGIMIVQYIKLVLNFINLFNSI